MTEMVLIRFTKLLDKLRNGQKRQTIRKPRIRPFKVGDRLQVYILEHLGDSKILKLERKRLRDLTLEDAINDGFPTLSACTIALQKMHNCDPDQEFDIVTFSEVK